MLKPFQVLLLAGICSVVSNWSATHNITICQFVENLIIHSGLHILSSILKDKHSKEFRSGLRSQMAPKVCMTSMRLGGVEFRL